MNEEQTLDELFDTPEVAEEQVQTQDVPQEEDFLAEFLEKDLTEDPEETEEVSEVEDEDEEVVLSKEILEQDFVKEVIAARIDEEIKSREMDYLEGLTDEARAFVEFSKAGGSAKEFLELIGEKDLPKVDPSDVSQNKEFIKAYMTSYKGVKPALVDSMLANLDDESVSALYTESVKEHESQAKLARENALKAQKEQEAARRQEIENNNNEVKTRFMQMDEIFSKKLTEKGKQKLIDYTIKPDNTGMTGIQKTLLQIFQERGEGLAKLADWLSNGQDIEKVTKGARTKNISNARDLIRKHRKESTPKGVKTGNKNNVDLHSFFN